MTLRLQRESNLGAKQKGFPYQLAALDAVKDLEYAAIFHEQGLGKTKIGVDLSLLWLGSKVTDSVLIVTKKGLIQNWRDEIDIHTFLRPLVLGQDRRKNFFAFNSPARLYLTHYEVLKSEAKRFALFLKTRKVGVILDEAQKIKNPDSSIAQALFGFSESFTRRVIMTGTPVANRPYDLWAQIYFLDRGASLGTDFVGFRHELDLSNDLWSNSGRAKAFEDRLASVFDKIRPFAVRETKVTASIELPNKKIHNLIVELEHRQAEIYRAFREEFVALVVKEGQPFWDNAEEILKRLLRLVQVASNPRLVDERYQQVPGKFPALLQLIEKVAEQEEKAIVWTSFTENVDWLARQLSDYGAVRVHGKMSHDDRQSSISAFKTQPNKRILIATPGAAKEGLTLTVANHAIFFDRSFSLDDYLQAQDRIHRISQIKTCFVTNLVAKDTVDEWVDVLLSAKHLAAKLAQGDITKEQYSIEATYAYGDMIKDILAM
jgi:SNF2 family DNA or RNA helicase